MSKTDKSEAAELVVPARYYLRALEMLQEENTDVNQILEPLQLKLSSLSEPDASLPWRTVEALIEGAEVVRKHPGLALDLGRRLKLTSHSFVGFGILSSPNVDYALRLAARYFRLIMPSFHMRYQVNAEQAEISYAPQIPMSQHCMDFHLEALAVATHYEARDLLEGAMPQYDLHLSYAKPAHAQRYEELREARCHFSSLPTPGISMRFPAAIANKPLALSDNAALKMAESRCRDLVSKVVAKKSVSDWIEMMLRESGDGMPKLAELAHTLNLSTRTLDRHLQREGTGFRDLRNRVQLDKARQMLSEQTQSITQIAHELGYTDAANFSRAFKREAGLSPRAYREKTASAS